MAHMGCGLGFRVGHAPFRVYGSGFTVLEF